MSRYYTIAVDAMGGDFGPRVTVPSSIQALSRHPRLTIQLIGHQDEIHSYIRKIKPEVANRLDVIHTDEVIGMDVKPSMALRHGKGSSMHLALKQVSEQQADACVSAGNTGALMVLGRFVLKTLPGIDRPAIISAVPTLTGHSYMLDLGANVDCAAEHLLQFAIMGSVMTQAVDQIEAPTVGLLNVGQEEIKGNEQVKLASRLISEHGELNYIGYIEGDDIFRGRADVVVCDGFVGNIALKGSEGLANLIRHKVRASFRKGIYRRFLGLLAGPVLAELNRQMDPSRRNGASLLGLQGIVVKSHGGANKKCFGYALDQAVAEIEMDLPSRIRCHVENQLT
ncbi:phosphate acyltransferase PlsX [Pontibacterium granulatum]|uniref:phosphate acyltransferase PlsX n=1 Tax=Pontibacterium granulatum TaxID=2036029 RepID=UPI00249CC900|nr:phosphate acyltransferase PlsX [Pontibacterium granulatum]MDI3326241.1 phosphate acyltransferase PlsX [Pontibacterium granulatum]